MNSVVVQIREGTNRSNCKQATYRYRYQQKHDKGTLPNADTSIYSVRRQNRNRVVSCKDLDVRIGCDIGCRSVTHIMWVSSSSLPIISPHCPSSITLTNEYKYVHRHPDSNGILMSSQYFNSKASNRASVVRLPDIGGGDGLGTVPMLLSTDGFTTRCDG